MLIFDIGFHCGEFTLANLAGNKIIAVEANPNLIHRAPPLPNVTLLFAAATDKLKSVPFYISNADTISTISLDWITSSRFSKDYTWAGPIEVKGITLDSMIQEYGVPDLIKIDVEGAELDVVRGLSHKVDILCFEWAEESYDKIILTIDRLKEIGFTEFGYIFYDNHKERPTNWGTWESLEFDKLVQPERKELWGMIFAR